MDLAPARIPKNVKNGQMVSHGDDSTILAIFSDEYIKNEFRSETEGTTIYDHFHQITLEYPGNNLNNFSYRFRPEEAKTSQWPQRFPNQWEAFKNQQEQVPDGTPIELWPPLDKRRVLELKAMKIYTVEQISSLTDITGPNMGMDWRKLRDQAKAFLEPNMALAENAKIKRQLEDKEEQIELLQRQVSALAKGQGTSMESLTLPSSREEPKRKGRPPKSIQAA